MRARGLFGQIRAQPGDQLIDFATAIQMAGVDTADVQINLVSLVIAEYLDGHRQVWRQRALAAFRQKTAFNDIA
jgi:hypothetical protein